jgi:membrane protease YdiL (CAAX protease family)
VTSSQDTKSHLSEPGLVGGRRLLTTIAGGITASVVIGAATWYGLHWLVPSNSALTTQIVVAEVYSSLIVAFVLSFGPLQCPPLGLRFTSATDLGLAFLAWVSVMGSALVIYLLLKPIAGGIFGAARQVLTLATDAKRLDGQPVSAWVVAIARGCLIVPLFEELFFRSLVLTWLRKRFSTPLAIIASAALFAAMHGYPIVLPFAFLFGLFAGWIRVRTGSALNTVFMHVLNNMLFLCLGLWLLR